MASVIGEELRRLVLAGVGATATTVEKSRDLIEDLVEKGELTVEQGKTMNEELKHNLKKTFDKSSSKSLVDELDDMDEEELEALKAKLAEMDKVKATKK